MIGKAVNRAGVVLLAFAAAFMPACGQAAEALSVVVSIKPLHALVAGVMGGVGVPKLLLEGGQSPHTYALKPSDARALSRADAVFWIGRALEPFLAKPIAGLPRSALRVALSEAAGVRLLPVREGGAWEQHAHGDGHDDHDHRRDATDDSFDPHLWLDPANAQAMVAAIAATLTQARPADAATFLRNAAALKARLEALDRALDDQLAPLRGRPYIVYHDAYQYFEARYGLTSAGAVALDPERPASAKRIAEIRAKLTAAGAACVFAEPQFPPAIINTVVEGTGAHVGVLDPLGADLASGPDAYFTLLHGLATAMRDCLG
jgi:zinc transport system substrate-binding protein